MIVHLVTHAHSNQIPECDARSWRLSESGRQQAADLARASFWRGPSGPVTVSAIIVSSEAKTRLTAEPAAQAFGLPIFEDARFDELHRTGWIEDYPATVAAALNDPSTSIQGWEPAAQVLARAVEALEEWRARADGQELVIVGHGICLSLVRAWLLGREKVVIDEWRRLPFGAWATVDLDGHRILRDFDLGATSR